MAAAMRGCIERSFCANSVAPALSAIPKTIPAMNFIGSSSIARPLAREDIVSEAAAWEAKAVAKIGGIGLAILGSVALAQTQYESPVWAPDGRSIAFVAKAAGGDWNIESIALDGTHRVQLTRQGAWDPAWSPDWKSIAFVSTVDGQRQISLMSPDGASVRQLTHGPAENFHPAWSRDGRRIACTAAEKA